MFYREYIDGEYSEYYWYNSKRFQVSVSSRYRTMMTEGLRESSFALHLPEENRTLIPEEWT